MIKKRFELLTYALVGLFLFAGCKSVTHRPNTLESFGLTYQLKEIKEPRPNRVHILRVDLANNRIQPAVVVAEDPDGDGPAEAVLTDPRKLACQPSVLAFVNTNPWDSFSDAAGKKNHSWFEGQPVDIQGLAASGSQIRSPAVLNGASVWFDGKGRLFLGDTPENVSIAEGTAGFQQIVKEGAVVVPEGSAVHPRTAIGADRDGIIMWLVVVDGRQIGYSEGMNLYELACLMRDLGCWGATNMDGGGSSIMGLAGADGQLGVVNSPSDRKIGVIPKVRPLPMILTIRQK